MCNVAVCACLPVCCSPRTRAGRQAPFAGGLPGFIDHVFSVLDKLTDVLYTVDHYGQVPADTEDVERGLSWHNYWHYGQPQMCAANAAEICNDQAAAGRAYLADAAKRNKPALVSEMGQFDCYCPAARGWQAAGVGWIAWELMMEHDQFVAFQGMVYKNGTWRNETERKCIAGLAMTPHAAAARSTQSCPPRPPPRPAAPPSWCGSSNCTFHSDVDAVFTWNPANNPTAHCWNPWVGGEGTSHLKFCDVAQATVTFTVPAEATAAKLIFKRGPDCGIMKVGQQDIDTFSEAVDWEAAMGLDLGSSSSSAQGQGVGLDGSKQFVVTVTGEQNSKSSHDWVQIVGIAVFH